VRNLNACSFPGAIARPVIADAIWRTRISDREWQYWTVGWPYGIPSALRQSAFGAVSAGKFPVIREIIGNFANRMLCGLFAGVKTDHVSVV
jgi:hypothetical protein